MSTPAEAFSSKWPLETVPIEVGDIVLEDQIVVEFVDITDDPERTLRHV